MPWQHHLPHGDHGAILPERLEWAADRIRWYTNNYSAAGHSNPGMRLAFAGSTLAFADIPRSGILVTYRLTWHAYGHPRRRSWTRYRRACAA
jgi:hypothetical protein